MGRCFLEMSGQPEQIVEAEQVAEDVARGFKPQVVQMPCPGGVTPPLGAVVPPPQWPTVPPPPQTTPASAIAAAMLGRGPQGSGTGPLLGAGFSSSAVLTPSVVPSQPPWALNRQPPPPPQNVSPSVPQFCGGASPGGVCGSILGPSIASGMT